MHCREHRKFSAILFAATAAASAAVAGYYYHYYYTHDETPLRIALPHQSPVKFVLVTALYDLHRTDRSFEGSYLPWFRRTIRKMSGAASQTVVFCKDRLVADEAKRAGRVIAVLEENYPLWHMRNAVKPILRERAAGSNAWHPEWMNPDYILLQFSKFRWLQYAMELLPEDETFFWVDAGLSRFLLLGQRSMKFPLLLRPGLISVQTQLRKVPLNATQLGGCMGCRRNVFKGGLFGGQSQVLSWLCGRMIAILREDFVAKGVMDNEQAALALLYSRSPERFNLLFEENFVGREAACDFICI